MEHFERGEQLDVVVACEKLIGYTGLELLSEVEAVSPPTLRIFAARPETLQRLGKQLDFFGLLGTLSYPIEARKLLVALKVARARLPGRAKLPAKAGHVAPPVVRHVVLENEWDTGERLALLGQQLEDTPEAAPEEPNPPPASAPDAQAPLYVDNGAANDELFLAGWSPPGQTSATTVRDNAAATIQPAPSAATQGPTSAARNGAPVATSASAKQDASAGGPSSAPRAAGASKPGQGPRPRQPTVPTAAQREAFQRALARRNAARAGGGSVQAPPPTTDISPVANTMSATQPPHAAAPPSESLSTLAHMATTKRPLPRAREATQPKRRVFVVGSGIAAVLLVGAVSFELLRTRTPVEHHHGRNANAQLFSPRSSLVADNSAPPPQIFSPAPPPPAQPAPAPGTGLPQPQTFNPDTAPPDPPPPPALERPGPMEPPSAHNEPPLRIQDVP